MRTRLIVVVLLIGIAGLASPALADTVYTYTGNYFATFEGSTFGTSDRVTATFSMASPLNASMPFSDVTSQVTAFTLSDGVTVFTNLGPSIYLTLSVAADGTGAITRWIFGGVLQVPEGDPTHGISSAYNPEQIDTIDMGLTGPCDDSIELGHCRVLISDPSSSTGQVIDNPGTWQLSTSSVPEPSSLILLASGLLSVVNLIRRKRR